jgi:hypothetical protein
MELHRAGNNSCQVADTYDMAWLKKELNGFEAFKEFLDRKRQRILKSCLEIIKGYKDA